MNDVETVKNALDSIIDDAYFLLQHLPDSGKIDENAAFTIKTYMDEILENSGCIIYIARKAE